MHFIDRQLRKINQFLEKRELEDQKRYFGKDWPPPPKWVIKMLTTPGFTRRATRLTRILSKPFDVFKHVNQGEWDKVLMDFGYNGTWKKDPEPKKGVNQELFPPITQHLQGQVQEGFVVGKFPKAEKLRDPLHRGEPIDEYELGIRVNPLDMVLDPSEEVLQDIWGHPVDAAELAKKGSHFLRECFTEDSQKYLKNRASRLGILDEEVKRNIKPNQPVPVNTANYISPAVEPVKTNGLQDQDLPSYFKK